MLNYLVNTDQEFFIALCKHGVHSYINLGTMIGNQKVLLGSFGKVGHDDASLALFFLAYTKGYIRNEPIIETDSESYNTVSYKAYSLRYEQYLQFLRYLKSISRSQRGDYVDPLKAYCPVRAADNQVELGWLSLDNYNFDSELENELPQNEQDGYHTIGVTFNNCRHSAIQLVKKGTYLNQLGSGVSSLFFKELPLKTMIGGAQFGSEDEYTYILPLTPASFPNIAPARAFVLNKVYRRLDGMLQLEQNNPLTISKFQALKEFYQTMSHGEEASLEAVISEVNSWVTVNQDTISKHRRSHWISFPTATEKMFAKLESGLKEADFNTSSSRA